jgi:xanthine dehydrogenase YagR molybdenum-binding subunit
VGRCEDPRGRQGRPSPPRERGPVPDVHIIEETDSNIGPAQAKGVGEIGIAAAAIPNAVHHATGIRVRDLPIRMDRPINATQASTSREKGDLQ